MAKAKSPNEGLSLVAEVDRYIRAANSAIWVQCVEQDDVCRDLVSHCEKRNWEVAMWDADRGLTGTQKVIVQRSAEEVKKEPIWYDKKPVILIKDAEKIASRTKAVQTVFVLKNFHRKEFLDNTALLQTFLNSIAIAGTKSVQHGWAFVLLSPVVSIPCEWENEFVVINQELPTRNQLWNLATTVAEPKELPKTEEAKSALLDAAIGMSRRAADSAFSLSIIDGKPFDVEVIQKLKAQCIKKRGLLTIYDGDDTFDKMGGLDHFKEFTSKLMRKRPNNPLLNPKGLLLLGVPGSGKSQAVKCLGKNTGRPVLSMDVGTLRSKYQGETDQNMRDALKLADAMAPSILFIDEIEKALSGVQSSGVTDGGTGARVFGTLLTWLNDHKTDVFFVGTCNDIGQLMGSNPEFARAERFDGMFFFDLPSDAERSQIWDIYLKMFELYSKLSGDARKSKIAELVEKSKSWTGAEIRQACRLSAMMDEPLEATMEKIVPIMRTGAERLNELREWADGLCMSATTNGLFKREQDASLGQIATDIKGSRDRRKVKAPADEAPANKSEPVGA